MQLNLIVLQDAAGNAGLMNIIMIVAVFAIFYLFMIRPQSKKQKEIRKFRDALSVGDKVVTSGGIYGKIRNIKDTTVSLEVTSGVCITIDKGSIFPTAADVQNDSAESK